MATVKDLIARLRERGSARWAARGLKPNTVALILAPLRTLLANAVDDGLLTHNPAARVGKWNTRRTEREAEGCDPFTLEELEAIATTAREQAPILWPLVGLWMQSGMREGEVFGLQWRDLDLDAGTAIVRRTLTKGQVGSSKTGRSRLVTVTHPLVRNPHAVLEALRDLQSVREAEATLQGIPFTPEAYVFLRQDGYAVGTRNIGHVWTRCLRLAGVRYRNPEQLRHTFASTLLSRGESLLYVQEQGGWVNATVLLTHYARWIPRHAPRLQPAATPAQPEG
jgi:integrase